MLCVTYRFTDESIAWMVANGQYKRANAMMQKAAKFNKITIPDPVFSADTEV